MTHAEDFLTNNGVMDRLSAVQQIGEMLQALNIHDFLDYGGRDFLSIGSFIEKTIGELITSLGKLEDVQRKEFMALKAKVPPDPEKIAAAKAHNKELALYMIDQTRFVSAETAEAIKRVIEEAEEFQGLTDTDEEPGEND